MPSDECSSSVKLVVSGAGVFSRGAMGGSTTMRDRSGERTVSLVPRVLLPAPGSLSNGFNESETEFKSRPKNPAFSGSGAPTSRLIGVGWLRVDVLSDSLFFEDP